MAVCLRERERERERDKFQLKQGGGVIFHTNNSTPCVNNNNKKKKKKLRITFCWLGRFQCVKIPEPTN